MTPRGSAYSTFGVSLFAATKFTPSRLPRTHVARRKLAAQLDEQDERLLLVVGPPGSGKSVLLTEWAATTPERYSWLECDERDSDSNRFWRTFVASLAAAEPDDLDWLDLVDLAAENSSVDDLVAATVNTLARSKLRVLVIDDAHLASAAMPGVGKLVEALPDGVRMILASRSEPNLPLHRYRARGQLKEVRQAQLMFSPAEASTLITQFDFELAPDDASALLERTEGWVAGLQLAALAMRARDAGSPFFDAMAASQRSINEFLLEEALGRQPDEVRRFLLDLSIFDEFDEEACTAVLGAEAARLMRSIEADSLFIVDLDGSGRRFRFHHLFRDLLRFQSVTIDPERTRSLHLRAAEWYEEKGAIGAALYHLTSAGEHDAAHELYTTSVTAGFYSDGDTAIGEWLSMLDHQTRTREPDRLRITAFAHALAGDLDEADRLLALVERARPLHAALDERTYMTRAVIELYRGEPEPAERAIAAATSVGAGTELLDVAVGMLVRTRLWREGPKAAHDILSTRGPSHVADPGYEDMMVTGAEAWICAVEGELHDAERLAGQAIRAGTVRGRPDHPALGDAYRALGVVAYERAELNTAEAHLERSLRCGAAERPAWQLLGELALARVWLARNRPGDALQLVKHARHRLSIRSTSPLAELADSATVRCLLAIGDTDAAGDLAASITPGARKDRLLAELAFRRGDLHAAAEAIGRLSPHTVREDIDHAMAKAHLAVATTADASHELEEALDRAHKAGFVQILASRPALVRNRARRHLRTQRSDEWVTSALAVLDGCPTYDVVVASGLVEAYDPLSDREVTILRHLASRLTNGDIAAELYLSVNTVKTHVQHIYRKLGVSSRTDAVDTARLLGLI